MTQREYGKSLVRIIEAGADAVRKAGGTADVCIVTPGEYVAICNAIVPGKMGDRLRLFGPTYALDIVARADAPRDRFYIGAKEDLS